MNYQIKTIIMSIFFIYFVLNDIHKKQISIYSIVLYGIFSLISIILDLINHHSINHIIINIPIGTVFLLNEVIGMGDSLFIFINGLLLNTNEYIIMIFSSFFIAFIIGIIIFIVKNKNVKNIKIPFLICFILFYIWRLKCIL